MLSKHTSCNTDDLLYEPLDRDLLINGYAVLSGKTHLSVDSQYAYPLTGLLVVFPARGMILGGEERR